MASTIRIITLEEGWDHIIKPAIEKIENILKEGIQRKHSDIFNIKEYSTIYTTCYNMCTQSYPHCYVRELYNRHGETINNYLKTHALPALREKSRQGGTIFLMELLRRWEDHCIMTKWLNKFFEYLDRYYVKHHALPTLEKVGLQGFRSQIYDEMKTETTTAILSFMNQERDGKIIDKSLAKSIVEIYLNMEVFHPGAYNVDFEEEIIKSTRDYYTMNRHCWIKESTQQILLVAEDILNKEQRRVTDYLSSRTESKILNVVDKVILEETKTELLGTGSYGFRSLLQNNKFDDLQLIFRVFRKIENGLVPFAAIVQEFLTSMGMDIIHQRKKRLESGENEQKDYPKFVQSTLELHTKFSAIIKDHFGYHLLFQKSLNTALVEIVNTRVGQFTNAELMSTFCDRILKSDEGKRNETEVEENLEQISQLFAYLADKDFFAEIYSQQLAKRLLNGSFTNNYYSEKLMITKLKLQCGAQFTSRMEAMLTDMVVGSQHQNQFDQQMGQQNINLDCSVQILTKGFWPSYKCPDVVLMEEMKNYITGFKEWYKQQYEHRSLQFVLTHGKALVRGVFGKKSYYFHVSTLQALVMVALNEGVTLTFYDLAQHLNLNESILKPLMHSLACGKTRVIKKSSPGNKISNGDKFVANAKFTSNWRKIRIPMPSLDSSINIVKLDEDRSIIIEATIIRIMKARKTLEHQQLLSEVLTQVSLFTPNPTVIKKRIAALIDREYLARNSDQPDVYKYLP